MPKKRSTDNLKGTNSKFKLEELHCSSSSSSSDEESSSSSENYFSNNEDVDPEVDEISEGDHDSTEETKQTIN